MKGILGFSTMVYLGLQGGYGSRCCRGVWGAEGLGV